MRDLRGQLITRRAILDAADQNHDDEGMGAIYDRGLLMTPAETSRTEGGVLASGQTGGNALVGDRTRKHSEHLLRIVGVHSVTLRERPEKSHQIARGRGIAGAVGGIAIALQRADELRAVRAQRVKTLANAVHAARK